MANKSDVLDANNFQDKRILLFRREDSFIYFVLKNNKIIKTVVEKQDSYSVGDVVMAQISKKANGFGAFFCKMDKDTEAFLPFDELDSVMDVSKLKVGDSIPVILKKSAYDNKKAVVSGFIELSNEYAVIRNANTQKLISFSKKIERVDRDGLISNLEEEASKLKALGLTVLLRSKCVSSKLNLIKENINILIEEYIELQNKAKFSPVFTKIKAAECYLNKIILSNYNSNSSLKVICEDDITYGFASKNAENLTGDKITIEKYEDDDLPLQVLYGLKSKFDDITKEKVMLPSGAYLFITPTPALVAIDVNAGKIDSKKDKEQTALRVNLEAAKAIAYHIEARNLSGILIIDFINMKQEENVTILTKSVKDLLSGLEVNAKLVDITKLGLAEVTVVKKEPFLCEYAHLINRTILM